MSEESPKATATIGRPGLGDAARGEVFGRLGVLTKGSEEYRRVRRELATKFDRTERAIDLIFDRAAEAFLTKANAKDKTNGLASDDTAASP